MSSSNTTGVFEGIFGILFFLFAYMVIPASIVTSVVVNAKDDSYFLVFLSIFFPPFGFIHGAGVWLGFW